MAIVLQDQSGLGQGIMQASGALAQALQQRGLAQQEQQKMSALEQALSTADLTSQEGQKTFLQEAMAKRVPLKDALSVLDQAMAQQKMELQMPFGMMDQGQLSGLFQRLGVSEPRAQDYAELYGVLPQGGRTAFANMFLDQLLRGDVGDQSPEGLDPIMQMNGSVQMPGFQEEVSVSEEVPAFDFPNLDLFKGLVPKEKAQMKSQLLKSNNEEYKDVMDKRRKTEGEIMRYEQLERLNEGGKLPKGLQMLNINWTTGDIRFPALANEQTQQFVKTINDFTVAAKDTFGSRVTNFELGSFMKRLPTLANSEEGRRLILAQMKAMKGLDRLYEDSLKQVYDHYGMQGVDRATVERVAEDLRQPDEERLMKQFADSVKAQEKYDLRARAPNNHVAVRKPDGTIGYLPMEKLDIAERKGWEVIQ